MSPPQNPDQLLRAADPAAALAALTEQVRAQPANLELRVFLAQLLCLLGQWERALGQLNAAAAIDASAIPMKQVYGDAVHCEGLRTAVFAGERAPMVLGQPDEWLALLIESLHRRGRGEHEVAESLRLRAFDDAPAGAGRINGQPFEWLADADMRIGPVLETYISGRYYWTPFTRLARVKIDPPEDLRDCVWMPAHLELRNGDQTLALIPTRYEGTETSVDGALQLARKTDWRELAPQVWAGSGQRVLCSDVGDFALMDVREIVFDA
jgi:type VI secretion system protein ImpE